jgi:hypothetical protein
VTKYQYVARTRLRVGDEWREPGALVPEAAQWPNLQSYINTGTIEEIPVPEGVEAEGTVRRERKIDTHVPKDYDERKLTPPPRVAEKQPQTEASQEVLCWNCATVNWLPAMFAVDRDFQCHLCAQVQSITESRKLNAAYQAAAPWSADITPRTG